MRRIHCSISTFSPLNYISTLNCSLFNFHRPCLFIFLKTNQTLIYFHHFFCSFQHSCNLINLSSPITSFYTVCLLFQSIFPYFNNLSTNLNSSSHDFAQIVHKTTLKYLPKIFTLICDQI